MNWNVVTVASTIVALGALAGFDIIPGAGFLSGVVMLATGATVLCAIHRERVPALGQGVRAQSQASEAMTSSSAGTMGRVLAAMVLLNGIMGAPTASAQDWTLAVAGATRAGESSASDAQPSKAGAAKRTYTYEESTRMGAEVQHQAEARQRGWDRKMKAVSGSICRGC